MAVNSRAKGREQEQIVARWLTQNGWPTKRRLAGNGQAGDLMIADAPDVVVDVKARKQLAIPAWLDQLEVEADGREHMALIVKVEGVTDPARWLVVASNDDHEVVPQSLCPWTLDKATVQDVLGWLRIEDSLRSASSAWVAPDGDHLWALMLADTWRTRVLPEWSGIEAVAS